MATICTHLNQIRSVAPSAKGCEDCLKTGDTWLEPNPMRRWYSNER
jgi:hypothetical protein